MPDRRTGYMILSIATREHELTFIPPLGGLSFVCDVIKVLVPPREWRIWKYSYVLDLTHIRVTKTRTTSEMVLIKYMNFTRRAGKRVSDIRRGTRWLALPMRRIRWWEPKSDTPTVAATSAAEEDPGNPTIWIITWFFKVCGCIICF